MSQLYQDAKAFYELYHRENGLDGLEKRLDEIQAEIEKTGTYWHSEAELVYGTKVAWRNTNRCIGRLFWKALQVRDRRNITTSEGVLEELLQHIELANNNGNIRPFVTVFRKSNPAVRIWNNQLVRYAGYEKDNQIIGDSSEVAFTKTCQSLGWQGKGGPFDVLPLVFQVGNQCPKYYELPERVILEVSIKHPTYDWFADFNLKWYGVPSVSNMDLEIGGIHFQAAPFSGWYMLNEIASRNFGDVNRYNMLPKIAEKMGLDTKKRRSLWKDRALLELNEAVLYSYEKAKVKIIDHHGASKQFMDFCKIEQKNNRKVNADWTWIVPPMSSATTEVFHQEWSNNIESPNFFYRDDYSSSHKTPTKVGVKMCPMSASILQKIEMDVY
jgi:nitric-oxide synthase